MTDTTTNEAAGLRQAIAGLEAQRALLGDAVIGPAIAALRQQLQSIDDSAAPADPVESEGERKLVTIMFADLTGFTALSERMDPEDVRNLVNRVFDGLVPIVERHGGVIDKFMGDAIMALFGAKVANEDDPQRALDAAIAMMEAMKAIAVDLGLPLGIHFGVNTGPVVTGAVGSSMRQAFSVMGDAVNLAARLEDLSVSGEILVGPATRRQVAAQFDFEERPPVTLKGKQQPVPIFRLIGRKREDAARGRLAAPMLGRQAELERLLAAVDAVGAGRGGAICIVGEAGLGKSRLAAEAWQRSSQPLRWLKVPPRRHGHASGFGAVRAMLVQLLGCDINGDAATLAMALRAAVDRYWPDGGSEAATHLAAMLGLEGLGLEGTVSGAASLEGVPADLLHARFCRTVDELLARCTADQPTVIVWEDLHWADPSSLKLVARLFETSARTACLHLATTRPEPEVIALLNATPGVTPVALEPIGPEASRDMLRALMATDTLDEGLARTLLSRAEGNPFYLEELIQSLIDTGTLRVVGGKASMGAQSGEAQLPPTMQGVIMARLDRLSATEKKIVQTASVLGRTFERRTIHAMLSAAGELEAVLRKLEILDIVRPTAAAQGDGAVFRFKHAVTQEVAYGSLLLTTRRKMHRRAAETIGARGDETPGAAVLLSHHFERSDQPARAAPWLLRAARSARGGHAIGEALDCYQRLVALDGADLIAAGLGDALVDAHVGRGELLQVSGRCDEALQAFAAALAHTPTGDGLRRAGLLRRCGLTEMARRNAGAALLRFAEADEVLGPDGGGAAGAAWWREWIEVRLERLWALGWAGQYREAARLTDEAAGPLALHGDTGQRARYVMQQFIFRSFREDTQISAETIALGRDAQARCLEWGDPKGLLVGRLWFGWGMLLKQDWTACEREVTEALRLARFVGDVEYEVLGLVTLTCMHRLMNDPVEADALSAVALEHAERAEMPVYVGAALANQAWVALRANDPVRAGRLARSAAEIWRQHPYKVVWLGHWPLLSLAIDAADWPEAAQQARVILGRGQYRMPDAIAAALQAAQTGVEGGDIDTAALRFSEAQRLARPLGMV